MVVLNVFNEALQVEQSRVAFVAMIKFGVDAKGAQHDNAADAQQIFLLDAVFPIPAVKFVGDGPVEFGIEVGVGVEQI